MAANPKSPVAPRPSLERYHVYHAEAHVLSGNLKHPVDQPIEHHAHVVLKNTLVRPAARSRKRIFGATIILAG